LSWPTRIHGFRSALRASLHPRLRTRAPSGRTWGALRTDDAPPWAARKRASSAPKGRAGRASDSSAPKGRAGRAGDSSARRGALFHPKGRAGRAGDSSARRGAQCDSSARRGRAGRASDSSAPKGRAFVAAGGAQPAAGGRSATRGRGRTRFPPPPRRGGRATRLRFINAVAVHQRGCGSSTQSRFS
jgi:hypothetical protein